MLDELEWSLTKSERKARKIPLERARAWIKSAGAAGGVSAPVSKSFVAPDSRDVRIDIEVIKGDAFV